METQSLVILGAFVSALLLLIPAAYGVKGLLTRTPRLQDEFVSKEEYRRHQERMESELARHTASRKGIYERLESQGRAVERIETGMEANRGVVADIKESIGEQKAEQLKQSERINKLDERLDALPERLARTLKEMKGLV